MSTHQDFSLMRVFFARRFESKEKHEFGVGAGLHSLEFGAFIQGSIDWFGASFDDYDDTSISASLGLNYQVFENFGVGLNYNVLDLDVNVKKTNWRGNANISYNGLYAYLSFYW